MAAPTLDDLRDVPEAAWLWDPARARIVWANPAGIGFFGGESLFDLLDRPFDLEEPGVERIVAIARTLSRGHAEDGPAAFPLCRAPRLRSPAGCMIHALPDGRPGAAGGGAPAAAAEEAGQTAEDIVAAFDLLPSAAVLVARDGTFRHLNAAALALLAPGQRTSLARRAGRSCPGGGSAEPDGGCRNAWSLTRPLAVRLGQRDIRLTLRRLNRADGETSPSPW